METELKRIRKKHFSTINDLSKDIGYDKAYVSRVERGIVPPSGEYVKAFMEYFGIEKEHPEYKRFIKEQREISIKDVEDKYA